MPDCPRCCRSFDSRRGLRVHHSHAHDEILPNRECAGCRTTFHCEYEKKYCSTDCREESVSFEGSNNPNYRGGKQETECAICGAVFEFYPSEKPGLFCQSCVQTEEWRHKRRIEGERNPRWSGGEIRVECDQCGNCFSRYESAIKSEHVFCSTECHNDRLSEAFTGDGHPNWKGGGAANYGPGWRRVRERALVRDGYQCVIRGTSREDQGRNPDVHHIISVRRFVETPVTTERDAHYLENTVSLCIGSHRRAEYGHISAERLRMAAQGNVD